MKTLKLFIASLIVFGFFTSIDLNAQEKWGKSGKWQEDLTFICPCAGEFLQGTIIFQVNENGKVTHVTIKGYKLIGITIGDVDDEGNPIPSGIPSGNVYIFSRVDHLNSDTGLEVWRIRTKRIGDGIVTNTDVYVKDGVIVGVDANCM